MTTWTLKCGDKDFGAVVNGEKCFDIRRADRAYAVGDNLRLVRTDAAGEVIEPRQEVVKTVHYILEGGDEGILDGYVVMGFSRPSSLDDFDDDEIEQAFMDRFPREEIDAIPRIYRLLAEGEVGLAMEEMALAFDLQPPDQESKLAALIARGRAGESSQRSLSL